MMKSQFFLLILLFPLITHAEPAGRILRTDNQQTITPTQLATQLSQATIVLIGEAHDSQVQHQAQQWLLEQTASQRASGSVVLEMLTPKQQTSVREVQAWLRGGGKSGIRSLAQKIDWNHAWDWQQYQGMMHTLLHQAATIYAGNPEREQLVQQQSFTPQGQAGNESVRQTLAQLLDNHHGNGANLVAMQQFKDHTMSQTLINAPKPAWLIAGAIHASKQLGVPLFLRDAHVSDGIKVLIMTEEGSQIDAAHADYIWFF